MPILTPDKLDFSNQNLVMIITGMPGVGKTTLALSSPDAFILDLDKGLKRVKPSHRKDASLPIVFEDMQSDIKSAIGVYKTAILDTGGALIEMLKEYAVRVEHKSKKSGGITQEGYGVVKQMFVDMFAELRRNFNVVLIFHTSKVKDGDNFFYDLVCEGSAKTIVWQPADLGAHLFIENSERYLGFTPTEQYNGKAAYGIKGLIKVPELKDGETNDFLTKLFAQVKANIAAEGASLKPQQEAYDKAMEMGNIYIGAINTPESATMCWPELKKLTHSLTSEKELKAAFAAKVKELGYVLNKQTQSYEESKKDDGGLL